MIWMAAAIGLQAVQQLGAARAQRAQTRAQNAQIAAYNKQVAAQAAKSFGEISIQKAVLSAQTTTALAAVQKQGVQQASARGLQAAASDTMGNSVDQNLLDVEQRVDEAKDQLGYNEQISDMSLNAQATAVADGAGSSLKSETSLNSWSSTLGQVFANVGVGLFENKAATGDWLGSKTTRTSRNNGVY